jgi:hypothetical protein
VLWLGTFPGLIHRERPDFAYTPQREWEATKKERIEALFPLRAITRVPCPISPRHSLIRSTTNHLNF